MEDTIKKADTVSAQLADLTDTLTKAESDMASGDPAAWIYDTIRNFKEKYKVDISVSGSCPCGSEWICCRISRINNSRSRSTARPITMIWGNSSPILKTPILMRESPI